MKGWMTKEEINRTKYIVCYPLCNNDKCCMGTDKCEAEIWAKKEGSFRKAIKCITT